MPITIDEAATFFHYIHLGKFWPGIAHWDANNHVLNSLLSWLSYSAFGNSELAIRLPNVLAGVLYFYYAYKLSFQVSNKRLRWSLFLALACSRFVIEFFALTRGYGMSMAFMMVGVFYLYRWMKDGTSSSVLLGVIAIQVATLANLSVLLVNLLFLGWIIYWLLVTRPSFKPAFLLVFVIQLSCLYWFTDLSFELKERGLLYYGEGTGFWEVTVTSITDYGFAPWGAQVRLILPLVLLILLLSVGMVIARSFKSKTLRVPESFFIYLFAGGVAANIALHVLFEVNYPEDRVALHYLVLLPCAMVFAIDGFSKESKLGGVLSHATFAFLLLFPFNLALNLNTSYSVLWERDASVKAFYDVLLREKEASSEEPTVVGYRMRSLPFNYYNFLNQAALSPIQSSGYRSNEADFQVAYLGVEADWSDYDTLLHHITSDLYLMRRKTSLERKLIYAKSVEGGEETEAEYIQWFGADIDSLRGKDLLWTVEIEMPKIEEPFQGWVSATVIDTLENQIIQEKIVLDWLKTSWQKGDKFRYQMAVSNIPNSAKHMKLFFWNINKSPIQLGPVEIKLSQLVEESETVAK